jgi:NADPH:quinone reductase-like Zn-dependent oxidoreductase
MRAFAIEDDWSLDHLRAVTRPEPRPGSGQALLRMAASSLNYRDLVVPHRGYGRYTGTLPLIPVSDGVGTVVETGPGVTRVKVGDRVCPCFFQGWIAGEPSLSRLTQSLGGPLDGTMAEVMCVPEDGLVHVPPHLTDLEAATLPCAALTAWNALAGLSTLVPGDHVLVQGTGGVALFAVQFAKLCGAHVTVLTSSAERMARVRALGADAAIDRIETPEWAGPARELTAGRGFDHIVELGGEKTLPASLRAIRPGGTISLIGVVSGGAMNAALGHVITRQVRLQGVTVGHRNAFEAMLRAIDAHRLRPVIDTVFPFADLKPALARLATGLQFGKICIDHAA